MNLWNDDLMWLGFDAYTDMIGYLFLFFYFLKF